MIKALSPADERQRSIAQAQESIVQAIKLLDIAKAPSDIAAHLDLALQRLLSFEQGE